MQWFNGTHIIAVIDDPTRELRVRIECAPADASGTQIGEFEPFIASKAYYWKDVAEILAEAVRVASSAAADAFLAEIDKDQWAPGLDLTGMVLSQQAAVDILAKAVNDAPHGLGLHAALREATFVLRELEEMEKAE